MTDSVTDSPQISAEAFSRLGLGPQLTAALTELGYEEPTPVQRAAIPPLLEGEDVLGQAATGTGKTAAFALPILEKIKPGVRDPFETSALILVPTRELAMQVAEAVHRYGKQLSVTALPVYGGQDIGQQLRRLKRGVDIVIATPGRALDHIRRKTLKLSKVETVVLDEADEMLDLGFADELDAILAELPSKRQTALFSATMAPRIAEIAEKHLKNPITVRIEAAKSTAKGLPQIRQVAYVVPPTLKEAALGRILDVESPRSAIIFCRTRVEVDHLSDALTGRGYGAAALHGGMSQEQRERVLKQFKSHKLELLIATDVAARGLDVEGLSHVVNYDLPTAPEAYVHRIGRTGRAGKEGIAISLVTPRETRFLRSVERLTGGRVEMSQLPTVQDLKVRRQEHTRSQVEAAIGTPDRFASFRSMAEGLGGNAELVDVAAAALMLLHEALHPGTDSDEREIPVYEAKAPMTEKQRRMRESAGPSRGYEGRAPRTDRPSRSFDGGDEGERRPRPPREPSVGFTPLFIGLGKNANIRPGDLVGAIANEAGVPSKDIGAIRVSDRHSTVEVKDSRVQDVLEALRSSNIRGRKVRIDIHKGEENERYESTPFQRPGSERPSSSSSSSERPSYEKYSKEGFDKPSRGPRSDSAAPRGPRAPKAFLKSPRGPRRDDR